MVSKNILTKNRTLVQNNWFRNYFSQKLKDGNQGKLCIFFEVEIFFEILNHRRKSKYRIYNWSIRLKCASAGRQSKQ